MRNISANGNPDDQHRQEKHSENPNKHPVHWMTFFDRESHSFYIFFSLRRSSYAELDIWHNFLLRHLSPSKVQCRKEREVKILRQAGTDQLSLAIPKGKRDEKTIQR